MIENRIIKILLIIIMVLVVVYILGQLNYIMNPIKNFFTVVFVPLLLGGFLYYLLRPLVNVLAGFLPCRILAIIITFILLFSILAGIIYYGGSVISEQFKSIVNYFRDYSNITRLNITNETMVNFLDKIAIEEKVRTYSERLLKGLESNILNLFSTITNIGAVILLTPIVLFYFLKDDRIILENAVKILPVGRREHIKNLLLEIDSKLQRYIGGRLLVVILLGILTYIGFLLIGLPDALILAIIAAVTSFVPIIGPIIGSLPALFIALSINIYVALKVLLVIVIIQQLEGNVIQPNIEGGIMKIHPLMVIFSVITLMLFFGFLGALFAVPLYVIVRTVVINLRQA